MGEKAKWVPLEKTQAEAREVDRLLAAEFGKPDGALTVLTGKDAKKDRVVELLGTRRWVHLATHGEFQQRRTESFGVHDALAPLDSVLVFAGANADATGGAQSLLTAEELSLLDLSRVELMVLSACQTGLGHVQAGQGQIGLVGALSRAGVGSVVASLWKVDDAATSRLMERFYEHAIQGEKPAPISAALRLAQVELLSGGEHTHPYYWAAWGVTGNPGESLAP
jgi:CHAT domain-containing protein